MTTIDADIEQADRDRRLFVNCIDRLVSEKRKGHDTTSFLFNRVVPLLALRSIPCDWDDMEAIQSMEDWLSLKSRVLSHLGDPSYRPTFSFRLLQHRQFIHQHNHTYRRGIQSMDVTK